MVMARLFSKSGISFAMAHCNFSLRGKDSDLDMAFVEQTSREMGAPFFCKIFDTKKYCMEAKLSVQEAARELRYLWLLETARENDYELVATAHHLDDSIETLLINMLRGTGIRGLAGIPEKTGNIIRPMLFAPRKDLEDYAREQRIEYRLDKSNLEEIYLRNRLRHKVVPILREINPGLDSVLQDFFDRMQATADLFDREVESEKARCIENENVGISISIAALLNHPVPGLLLYEFLRHYQFSPTVCRQLFDSLNGQPGKIFYSKTHQATKDRKKIFVIPLHPKEEQQEYKIDRVDCEIRHGKACFTFELKPKEFVETYTKEGFLACFDADKLLFPLTLRKVKPGDRIIPLGMKGKKKVSDLLTEKKIPVHNKFGTWVLVSGSRVIWVAGLRTSEDSKIDQGTRMVLSASLTDA